VGIVFETGRAERCRRRMRELGPITDEMMRVWMEQWGL
jgi:hypothetical protein